MSNNRFPLSSDVSQIINPWVLWVKSLNQQLGFIDVYNLESGDSQTEKKIIEEVASYGRQRGWIKEVLDVVVSRLLKPKYRDLTEEEREDIDRLYDLIRRIEEVKQDSKPFKVTLGNVNRMIDYIRALKKKDEKAYAHMVSRIKDAFLGV